MNICFDLVRLFSYLTARLTQSISRNDLFPVQAATRMRNHTISLSSQTCYHKKHNSPAPTRPIPAPLSTLRIPPPPDRHRHTPAAREAFFLLHHCRSRKFTEFSRKPTQPARRLDQPTLSTADGITRGRHTLVSSPITPPSSRAGTQTPQGRRREPPSQQGTSRDWSYARFSGGADFSANREHKRLFSPRLR